MYLSILHPEKQSALTSHSMRRSGQIGRRRLRQRHSSRCSIFERHRPGITLHHHDWAGAPWQTNHVRVKNLSVLSTHYSRCLLSTLPPSSSNSSADGAVLYQQYQDVCRLIEEERTHQEETKSRQMYEAWQRQQERHDNQRSSKRSGVAVVKTLARHTTNSQLNNHNVLPTLHEQAQHLLQRASAAGHAPATIQLGNQALAHNRATEALALYRQAPTAPAAWFNIGHILWDGHDEVPADRAAALQAFERAIALGDTDAMYFVGGVLLEEDDSDSDSNNSSDMKDSATTFESPHQRGWDLLRQAGDAGHGGALYHLVLLHVNGNKGLGIAPCTPAEFRQRLDQAVTAGHAEALFARGHAFYHGHDGYERDIRQALHDWLRAADLNHADAAVSAGAVLHRGAPPAVPRDQERAFALYQHAGELGSVEGWRNVVACYAAGEGVPRSPQMAKYIAETILRGDV